MPALIITRMDGERFVIRVPGQPDITVEVWSRRLGKTAVRIVAPESVEIIRSELLDTTRAR